MTSAKNMISRELGEGLVVARPGGHRLFVMNASARFIWTLRTNGVSDEEIPARLVAHYGIGLDQARADFARVCTQWQREGLTPRDGIARQYRLGGVDFRIVYGDPALDKVVARIFEHIEVTTPAVHSTAYEYDYFIADESGRYVLRGDGIEMISDTGLDKVIETLTHDAVMHAYGRIDWQLSLHAGAVGNDQGCILLPGESGSGKSTLTAALLAGTRSSFLTDDIVLLQRETLNAVPMPSAIVLKEGGWPVLAGTLPELGSLPVFRRYGADVRYFSPPRDRISQSPLPVQAVVFPSWRSSETTRMSRLAAETGFERMIAAPATVNAPILAQTVARLADWAAAMPFYELEYGSLDEAVGCIRALLGE